MCPDFSRDPHNPRRPAAFVLQPALPPASDLPRQAPFPAACTCPLPVGSPFVSLSSLLKVRGTVAATPTLRIASKTASALPQSPQQANRASPASGWSSPHCQRVILGGGADQTGGWLPALSHSVRPGISASEGRCHLSKAIADFFFLFSFQNSKCPPPPPPIHSPGFVSSTTSDLNPTKSASYTRHCWMTPKLTAVSYSSYLSGWEKIKEMHSCTAHGNPCVSVLFGICACPGPTLLCRLRTTGPGFIFMCVNMLFISMLLLAVKCFAGSVYSIGVIYTVYFASGYILAF